MPPHFLLTEITTFVSVLLALSTGDNNAMNFEFGKSGTESTIMNCEQKLMEDMFICLTGYNIVPIEFFLAIGKINGTKKNPSPSWVDPVNDDNIGVSTTTQEPMARESNVTPNSSLDVESNQDLRNGSPAISSTQDVDFVPSNNTTDGTGLEDSPGMNDTDSDSIQGGHADDNHNAEDEQFRSRVCRVQREVMECTFGAAKSLLANPACSSSTTHPSSTDSDGDSPPPPPPPPGADLLVNDQTYRIKATMEDFLGQYDVYCAQRCRTTLLEDMRSCYETFDLEATLFMSEESHGAVIGDNAYDVEIFCNNRDPIVKCLRSKTDNCDEADLVLSAIGLDLELMERGFETLCKNQYTYLRSLECFESHTARVGICHSVKHRKMIDTASFAKLQNWTGDRYMQEICSERLDHIRCDLDAWANKNDDNCDEHILDLKRRVHCSLLPQQCSDMYTDETDVICNGHSSKSRGSSVVFVRTYNSSHAFTLCLLFIVFILQILIM